MVMPATEPACSDIDLLSAEEGRIFRLELDPVAVDLGGLVEMADGDRRLRKPRSQRGESHTCERSDHHNSYSCGEPLLPRTQPHFFSAFRYRRARIDPGLLGSWHFS